MPEPQSLLNAWDNFYVIIGSSAGALIGLQFVVIALIAETDLAGSMLEIRAFGTPTIVHFSVVLLIAGIVNAPWHGFTSAAICIAFCGSGGVAYILLVIRHARRQTGYSPDAEDWFWYTGFPFAAYATLLAAAVVLPSHPASSLFAVAGTALALLFIGIHNAWDTVTFIAVGRWGSSKRQTEAKPKVST
jgi:hypothetical protein